MLALFFVAFSATAQTPEVPHKMDFAGITLTIRDDARREIQKDVNALTQSPRHHLIKVERARTYFPVIEKVFADEGVPDDFKYLVLQESALIADAVSVSNAVGFWQFKDFTAVEMGLRVDKEIDERLNIVSSTRAAARYIKKNNTVFDNWVYALQAYQMGAGGVMRSVSKDMYGKKSMEVTSGTYWYVKKFLAHKIAFEGGIAGPGQIKVVPYVNSTDKHLRDLAREVSVDELELINYNKWAKKGSIPGDRSYTVMIPMKGDGIMPELPSQPVASTVPAPAAATARPATTSALKGRTKINGISAIRPEPNETPSALASRAGVGTAEFLKWNEMSAGDKLQPDTYYLLGKKRARAVKNYHTSEAGEDLWKISQRYGVQLRKLKRYNRMSGNEVLEPGTTVWLSSVKPRGASSAPVARSGQPVQTLQVEAEDENAFSWTVDPSTPGTAVVEHKASSPTASTTSKASPQNEPVSSVTVSSPTKATPANESIVSPVAAAPVSEIEGASPDKAVSSSDVESVSATSPTPAGGPSTVSVEGATSTEPVETAAAVNASVMAPAAEKSSPEVTEKVASSEVGAPLVSPAADASNVVLTNVTPPETAGSDKTSPVSKPSKKTHVVKAGETLYGIAREYNVGVMELVEWNELNLQEGIKPGQVLNLRSTEVQAVSSQPQSAEVTIEHIVRSSDTLYSVARKYNVTIKELMDWNNKKDFSLSIGEKLIVKSH